MLFSQKLFWELFNFFIIYFYRKKQESINIFKLMYVCMYVSCSTCY